jgi:PBP1b-binding outer membrane lipoprotein LpoB
MKKLLLIALGTLMLAGCVGLHIGGGPKTVQQKPTVGQQLIDLQKARDTGVITEDEYRAQKAKLMGN